MKVRLDECLTEDGGDCCCCLEVALELRAMPPLRVKLLNREYERCIVFEREDKVQGPVLVKMSEIL